MAGFLDVPNHPLLQSHRVGLVFLARYIVLRLVEQLEGFHEAIVAAEVGVDRHVILNVLAVHDGRLLDLADGLVDMVDGVHFLGNHRFLGEVLEMSARIAQIRERMQVGRDGVRGYLPTRASRR